MVGLGARGGGAFRAEDGTLAWSRPDSAGIFIHEGRLFSQESNMSLALVDPATGVGVSSVPLGHEYCAGMPAWGEVVLRPHDDGTGGSRELSRPYRSMRLETGQTLWKVDLAQQISEVAKQGRQFVTNLIPGSLGVSWIGRWRESTFACSRQDGSLLWLARDVECGLRADSRGGRVMGMARGGGWFYLLDEKTGEILARHDGSGLEGAAYPLPGVFLGDYVIYGMESGHLAVFDSRDGHLVWAKRHPAPLSDVRVIGASVYVVTGKGELLVYEAATAIPGLA